MSLEQELLNLKTKSDKLNSLRIENQVKLQSLEQDKVKLLEECKELGIEPATIEEALKNEEIYFQKELAELETKINRILDEISKL